MKKIKYSFHAFPFEENVYSYIKNGIEDVELYDASEFSLLSALNYSKGWKLFLIDCRESYASPKFMLLVDQTK